MKRQEKEALVAPCLSTAEWGAGWAGEEMSASRAGSKAELYYHDLSEEEDLSKLVTVHRNAAKIFHFQ